MAKRELLSIMYWTAPEKRERDPAKAINVLYDLVQQLAEEKAGLEKWVEKLESKIEKLEGKKVLPFKKKS
jgi:hypothetical protein